MKLKHSKYIVMAATLLAVGQAQAASSFWFAAVGDATGTPLTSLTIGGAGSTFDVAVWYSSDTKYWNLETLVGFDHSTSSTDTATPMDNLLGLDGTPDTALTIVNPSTTFIGSPVLGGGMLPGADTGTRSYGIDAAFQPKSSGTLFNATGAAGVELFTLKLKNKGLGAGQSAKVNFFTADETVPFYATFLIAQDFSTIVPTTTDLTVRVAAVPEPASMAALAFGAVALLRRRSKK